MTIEKSMKYEMMVVALLASMAAQAGLVDEVKAADERADAAVAAIRTPAELQAKQAAWRAAWLEGIGGLPVRTPLNAKEGPVVACEGFTLQNVLFESMPGVYVVGHLARPSSPAFKAPYPCVMMPLGHSDNGILNPRYAAHLAMTARAGFAVFAWDPASQGERRQSPASFDYTDNCSTEHTSLGARGWLVGWNFARFRIWDALRAVDYVATRKDLDISRLGVMGTSGGGTMSAYMQALDDRIKVAFPNCYVSSLREVVRERGCHDAEQFFFGQLRDGVNHAAMLALGFPRVALATGSRWKDYFPHAGAVSTFAVYSNLVARLWGQKEHDPKGTPPHPSSSSTFQPFNSSTSSFPLWHFSCDGPHGLPASTRAAQTDWMRHCIQGAPAPKALAHYRALDPSPTTDAANGAPLPFPAEASYFTASHQVRDLPGFKSLYTLIDEEATRLEALRQQRYKVFRDTRDSKDLKGSKKAGEETRRAYFREAVRRLAGIRPLAQICAQSNNRTIEQFNHSFKWWYLKGREGVLAENETAILALLGRSRVGEKAEAILRAAAAEVKANDGKPVPLVAVGADCVAAAHAYAAEPQLFSEVRLSNPPPSWREMVRNPNPREDSFATAVWGALKEYDWIDLVPPRKSAKAVASTADPHLNITLLQGDELPSQGVARLADGEINPTCAFLWRKGKPVEILFTFSAPREVGGIRLMSGRSWINCGVRKASFYADGKPLREHFEFRPANTYKESYLIWKPTTCSQVKMVIEDTYDFKDNYYCGYTHEATKHIGRIFETPPYTIFSGKSPTVQIAEVGFFGREPPADLPLPNKDGTIAYPDARLVRDWQYQSCAVSNVSHCASVEPDTTKPDPLGEDISKFWNAQSGRLRPPVDTSTAPNNSFSPPGGAIVPIAQKEWRAAREKARRAFLAGFRKDFTQFVYVKHIVMGNSIFHATDDLTDASYQEWRSVPDYTFGASQLILATIHPDGSVSQEVLLDEPNGIIRDPNISFDAKTLVFSKRRNLERDNYHLWTLDLDTRKLTQLTFNPVLKKEDVPGQTNDVELICSDIEPAWLPDGSIVFQSTRCSHSVDCWPLPVSNLHRCDADGRNIRRIGFDQVQTFYPQLMDDGRVCYTRWEYNDRSASGLQQLYAMNPDGTKQTGLFANNSEFPFSLIHTRGIPGTRKLMTISSGHHVGQKGRLAEAETALGDDYTNSTYDPAKSVWGMSTNAVVMWFPGNRKLTIPWSPWDNPSGPAVTNMPGMWYLAGAAMNAAPGRTPVRQPHDYHYNVFDMHTQFGPQWAYPYPLDENRFLVSYMPEGCRYYRGPYSSRFGVYAMTADGRRELLAFDWGQHCMQPVPVRKRTPPPRLVPKLDYAQGFGTYYVQNVYEGAAMKGAPKGCVKKIRVIGLEYRPVHIGWNWQYGWHSTQGKIGTPISVGNGAYDVKHVLGEADVEADGSCSFQAPVRTPLYFQLIDAQGCCVQTMRSWSTLQPGEINGCIGCHEHPHQAGLENATSIALRRPPQKLRPWLPGGTVHPYLTKLEKEGPLASLDNWMGLNRPKEIVDSSDNDGFSFSRIIQPILDAKCVRCHNGGEGAAPKAMDLRGVPGRLPPSDDQSKRRYSTSYLALTYKGQCNEKINFAHGLGFAPFKPPYSFGAAKSTVWQMLAKGHHGVKLTDAELRTLACWIDLAVPFCGSYMEHHDWNDWYIQRFQYTSNKRSAFAWLELNEVRAEKGLAPVPLTGFKPNVAESRRQTYWAE